MEDHSHPKADAGWPLEPVRKGRRCTHPRRLTAAPRWLAAAGLAAAIAVGVASPPALGEGTDVLISDHPEYRSPQAPMGQRGMDPTSAAMVADSRKLLDSLQPCCSSFDQLTYAALPSRGKLSLHHGQPDTVMLTPYGKSYVTALALPTKRRRNRLRVASAVGWHPPSIGILPQVIFLDANGQPMPGGGDVEAGRARKGGEQVSAEIPAGAVRALIVTAEDALGSVRMQCREVGGSMVMVGQGTFVPTPGQSQCWTYPLGVVGEIEARLVR